MTATKKKYHQRKSRAKYVTPPPDLVHTPGTEAKTPTRSIVFAARLFRSLGHNITEEDVEKVF